VLPLASASTLAWCSVVRWGLFPSPKQTEQKRNGKGKTRRLDIAAIWRGKSCNITQLVGSCHRQSMGRKCLMTTQRMRRRWRGQVGLTPDPADDKVIRSDVTDQVVLTRSDGFFCDRSCLSETVASV
jgi:hypothetical protein